MAPKPGTTVTTGIPEMIDMNMETLRRLYRDGLAENHDAALVAIYDLGKSDGILAAATAVSPVPAPVVVQVSHVPMRPGDIRGGVTLTPIQEATIHAFERRA
jgi:hypothetical protein